MEATELIARADFRKPALSVVRFCTSVLYKINKLKRYSNDIFYYFRVNSLRHRQGKGH